MNRRAFFKTLLDVEAPPHKEAKPHDIHMITIPTTGYPREYARHTLVLVADAHAWLGRDELGFYAVDAICPHLGSVVRPVVKGDKGFVCPCHGSTFAASGEITSGPAQHRLRYLLVDLDSEGKLVIRREQTVSPDDRFIA